jgi:putative ABC transport system permease protein
VKREIDEELSFHIEQRAEENRAAGMEPDDAAREARKRFGNAQRVREECREARGAAVGETVWQDLRFGARMLWKSPGFTAVAVMTLALGIGAGTAIYNVVNSVLINPIPGTASDRLVQIAERTYTQGLFHEENLKPNFCGMSPPVLEAVAENGQLFGEFAWASSIRLQRKTEDFVAEEPGWLVSPNFFGLWNVPPLLGRTFGRDEGVPVNVNNQPVRDAVVVLSYSWWKSQFGGDAAVLGRNIELSGRHFTVIGVMPSHVQFPWGGTDFWLPAEPVRLPPGSSTGPNIRVFARLKSEVSIQQTEAMLGTVAQRLAKEHEGDKTYGTEWSRRPGGLGFWVRPVREQFTDGRDDLRRTLFGLVAAIGFVMLIVCANLANLTLARTEKRRPELVVRSALGAGRRRLIRQLLTESVLLAGLGGIGGVVVAAATAKLLATLVPTYMPRLKAIGLDGHALGFALLTSVGAGLAFGFAPALYGGRERLGEALKQAGAKATGGVGRRRYRGALVVAELTLTLVLLTGAGLMIESVVRLLHVDPGFDPANLVRIDLQLPWDKYNDPEHSESGSQLRQVLYTQLHERLAALPGVKAVGIGKHGAWPVKLSLEGRAETVEALLDGCGVEQGDLFRAMRIPLRAGRYFDQHDVGGGVDTVIVNETMARMFWPGEDALGKRFTGEVWPGHHSYQVVGVVGDIRDYRYDQPPRPTFYRPCHELRLEGLAPFFVARTQADPRSLVPAIRKELIASESQMREPRILVCRQVLYDSTQAQRAYLLFLVVFASVGLLLATIGIYGVLAYSVARRTREIGIRMALGAERGQVLLLVMGEGMRLILIGVACGLLAAFWLTRLLRSQLFEVSPADPVVFAAVVVLLVAVALLACWLPARRAMKIDPMKALRYE